MRAAMRGRLAVCAALALALAGCMSTPVMDPPLRDRGPLDRASPVYGLTVSVHEFELATEIARYDGSGEWFGIETAQQLARGLRELGAEAIVVARGDPPRGDVQVRGRIVTVDGGSASARRWAGFGAGPASFVVEGEVVRSDGTPLGRFRDKRQSGAGAVGNIHLLEKCVSRVGRDVARMVTTGEYSQTGGDSEE